MRSPLVPFAALSASYFAHIGFFNPYLPLWLKELGLPIVVISLLTSVQSFTRVFAPYAWGALSDHTGERVRLLRISAAVALVASAGLWIDGGPWWIALVLLVLFTHTSSMMSLTEAAMAQLVAGDWGRYGRIRLWGSAGFLVTVFAAGAWFERFGLASFPAWSALSLGLVLLCTLWLPDTREPPQADAPQLGEPVAPVLRQPVVRWFFASLLFHVMAHFAIYGFFSLYLDALGYDKAMIGLLWAVSVAVEIAWFFNQGRFIVLLPMSSWLVVCGAAMVLRMAITGGLGFSLAALLIAQVLHALTFATHHTACIALVSQHFPGPVRGPGPARLTRVGDGGGGGG
ncbi:MAG: MFS transporter, partial [Ramlibacter sp.]|nr:MFS transporter [Ramlibacter sp.]